MLASEIYNRTETKLSADIGNPVRTMAGTVMALALSALLAGCASSQPMLVSQDVVVASGLYDGEPVALHATEIPVTSAEEARARARAALLERDRDLALYLYVQAVTLDPLDAESFRAIGALQTERGNREIAARAYLQAVELEPGNAAVRQALGLSLFEMRQFDPAESHLASAIELDSTLWRAHNTLGILADRKERYELAVEHYSAAIASQPMLASVHNNRGYSRYLAGDFLLAKQDFIQALDIDPAYDRAWRNLGLVLVREKDYAAALNAMTNASIARHVALNDVGYVAMLDGDYAVARRYFEDAIMESPRHYQTAQENLAELNRRNGSVPAIVDSGVRNTD